MNMKEKIDISRMSREEKLDLLSRDFLERDGDHFVRIRRSGRLGWEDALPADTAYSSVILNPESGDDLVKSAYRLASQMIVAMDTPFKVTVRIDATRSCTDSRSVFVASKVLDETGMSVGKRLDVFLGLAIHEGSHLLYTDFGCLPEADNAVVHYLQNLLEDERIERELGERKPGLANFIKAAKEYHFGRFGKAMDGKDDSVREGPFTRLCNAVFCIVRYPASLDMDDAAEFADTLLEVRSLLAPYPESTAECLKKAREIYDLIRRRLGEERQEQEEQEQEYGRGQDSRDKDGERESEGNGKSDDGKEGEGTPAEGTDGAGKDAGAGGQAVGEATGKEDSPSENSQAGRTSGGSDHESGAEGTMGSSGSDPLSDEEAERLFGEIADALSELTADPVLPGENPLSAGDMASAARKEGALLAKECEGVLERGTQRGMIVLLPEEDATAYAESLRRVRRYIPAVAQALRCNSTEFAYTVTGMRSGLLDTNKLGEALQGVPTVYVRKGEVRSDRVSVALLVDESGSMDGIRERLARDTAVLVNEAVGKIPNVGLYIYGFTSMAGHDVLRRFREGNDGGKATAIGSVGSFGGTPTAAAILETASRVRKRTRERTLLFIVSDGCADGGPEAVRRASDTVRRDGFTPVGVSIASALPDEELRRMYGSSYIVMEDVSSLAVGLGKIVKKAVLKAAGRKAV